MTHEDPWRLEYTAGQWILRCVPLTRVPGLVHAFSTRKGPDGAVNDMGGPGDMTQEYTDRRARFMIAAGFAATRPVLLSQVHGSAVVPCPGPGENVEADGVLLRRDDAPTPVPSIRTADCVPVILAEQRGWAAAVIHAGWRGTAAGIIGEAIHRLGELGARPERLLAALGPAIGRCCYEVGAEVVEAVAAAIGGDAGPITGKHQGPQHLDLHRAIRIQLARGGVPEESIQCASLCTSCIDDLFFSYRRDGKDTGRQMASIAFTGASA